MIICLEQSARDDGGGNGISRTVYGPSDAIATPIVSCFFKIQNGLTFLVLAYPGCPEKEADKWVSVSSLFLQLPGNSTTWVMHYTLQLRHDRVDVGKHFFLQGCFVTVAVIQQVTKIFEVSVAL